MAKAWRALTFYQQAETQYAWQSSEHNKSKEHLITVDPQKEGHPTVGERNPETLHPNYPIRNDWILNLPCKSKGSVKRGLL